MRSIAAIDVRKRFGQVLDEAAGGERLIIERAGQPIAALVPLSDLAALDPDSRRRERLRAIAEVARSGGRVVPALDIVEAIRDQRRLRDSRIVR